MHLRGIALSLLVVLSCLISSSAVSASWAFPFVVFEGSIYVHQGTYTPADKIGKKIGEVTFYSDQEGTYAGNFSNEYPKGTPYYHIIDVKDSAVIAVKEIDGRYATLVYYGKYAGKPDHTNSLGILIISLLIVAYSTWLFRRKRRSY